MQTRSTRIGIVCYFSIKILIMFAKFYCSLQPNKSFLPNNSLAKVLLDCLKNLSLTLVNCLKTLASEHVNLLCRKICPQQMVCEKKVRSKDVKIFGVKKL